MSLTYGKQLMKVEEYVNVLKIAAMRRKMLYVSEKRPEYMKTVAITEGASKKCGFCPKIRVDARPSSL